jgi:hypothetical protein
MPSRASLAAAARRFAILLAGITGVTALGSLVLGLAAGSPLERAVSVGFYVVGSFLLVAGFFIGNRGPVRLRHDSDSSLLGPRRVRVASLEEREGAMNDSAIFIVLGLLLIVIGVVVDARMRLV